MSPNPAADSTGRRALVVVTVALALLCTGVVWLLAQTRDPGDVTECLALRGQKLIEPEGPRALCLEQAWLTAVANGQGEAFLQELDAEITPSSPAAQECHIAGHRAGVKSFTNIQTALDMLAAPRPVVCEFGFEHGLLDGLAASEASMDDYKDLVRACTTHDTPQRDLCIDGSGHSIWQRYRDLDAAVELCLEFEQAVPGWGGSGCLGGVIMQFFRVDGVTGREAASAPAAGAKAVDALCRAASAARSELADHCYAFGAEPMALLFSEETTTVLGQERIDVVRGSEAVRQAARKAVTACDYYAQYSRSCRDRLRESAQALLRGQAQYLEAYCTAWRERSEPCQ